MCTSSLVEDKLSPSNDLEDRSILRVNSLVWQVQELMSKVHGNIPT